MTLSRLLRWLLVLAFFGVPAALAAAALLAIEDQPRVDQDIQVTVEHIERAKAILDRHNIRRRTGSLAAITVRADDAAAAANYAAKHFGHGSARLKLGMGEASVAVSLPLRQGPLSGFINLDATLQQTGALPSLRDVRIGRLPLPDWLANLCARGAIAWAGRNPSYKDGVEAVRAVRFSPQALRVVYVWRQDLPQRIGRSVASSDNFDHLRPYQERLAALSTAARKTSLADLIGPMFALVSERVAQGDDPAEASRSALLVLTLHTVGQPLWEVAPAAKAWRQPAPQRVSLNDRPDTAEHFIVSAALAAYADTQVADVLGIYKELSDSRGGSGFSFNDLAADRAGTRFGERAVAARTARTHQQRLARGITESDLLPPVADLPEDMQEADFARRFGGIDGEPYRRLAADIERRLDTLPLLAPRGG